MSLLGPNGAGKTTTVRMLATLSRPDGGYARVAGHDVVHEASRVRRLISLTGQFAALDKNLTARENIVLMARLRGLGRREAVDGDRGADRAVRDRGVPQPAASRTCPAASAGGSTSRPA